MSTKKPLGLWRLTSLVTGNMIGSGVFLLPASLAAFGTISLAAWVFTALGAFILALVFANLGQAMPKVGGPYAYCREAYGDFIGFLVAYNYWIALWVGNGAIALAFVGYLSFFAPALASSHVLTYFVAVGVVWLLTVINIIGVRQAGIVQLGATVLKLLPLIVIGTVGLLYIQPEHYAAFNISTKSNWGAFIGASALTLWSFIGLEAGTVPAGEVDEPEKTIPKATLLGTSITAVVYILGSIAIMGIIPTANLAQSNAPYADAARVIFGHWGGGLIAIGAAISCFGALNGWIMLHGQVPMAAAQDDLFPSAFKKKTKQGTPIAALLISATLITILLSFTLHASLVKQFTFIILLAVFATLVPYLLTTIGEIILFIKYPEKFSKKRLRRSIIIAILAFGYSFWMAVGAGQETLYYGTLLLFSGVPVYVWMRWQNRK